jgi:hypothetical protein
MMMMTITMKTMMTMTVMTMMMVTMIRLEKTGEETGSVNTRQEEFGPLHLVRATETPFGGGNGR